MKIGILSYPMLFQNTGGLQVQIKETVAELSKLGLNVTIVDPTRQRLSDFDLVHVFSAINGNYRIVEQAHAIGVPVVVSPLIRPHWTRGLGWIARRLESVVGRTTGWSVSTEYRQIESCLKKADALIALGTIERNSIISAFGILSEKIHVIPNGVPSRFYTADPGLFCEKYKIAPGFVLSVATISPHKNQLTLASALKDSEKEIVLIGPCLPTDQNYLRSILSFSHIRYIGPIDYEAPLLPSAYSAASVFCLPALSEVMPLSVMEALATDTPVVMTRHHCMDISSMRECIYEIDPKNPEDIKRGIHHFEENRPAPEVCQSSVSAYQWNSVAKAILDCYNEVLEKKSSH